jgi:dTMP kinase
MWDGYTRAVTTHPPAASHGRFITLEGPDGAGKTSQAEAIRQELADRGIPAVVVREPGGTPAGEAIRGILLDPGAGPISPHADALLFNAARAELVARVIRPALARGEVVLSARFADSTLTYQGFGEGLPLDALRLIQRFATDDLTPDLTVLLDLPVEVGLARKSGAEVTRFEEGFDVEFHRRVRDGFLALAAAEPGRFVVIDARASAGAVTAAVLRAIDERLPELAVQLLR